MISNINQRRNPLSVQAVMPSLVRNNPYSKLCQNFRIIAVGGKFVQAPAVKTKKKSDKVIKLGNDHFSVHTNQIYRTVCHVPPDGMIKTHKVVYRIIRFYTTLKLMLSSLKNFLNRVISPHPRIIQTFLNFIMRKIYIYMFQSFREGFRKFH